MFPTEDALFVVTYCCLWRHYGVLEKASFGGWIYNVVLLSNILWTQIVIIIQTVITSMLYILCLARSIIIILSNQLNNSALVIWCMTYITTCTRAANNFPAGTGQTVRSILFLLGHIHFWPDKHWFRLIAIKMEIVKNLMKLKCDHSSSNRNLF